MEPGEEALDLPAPTRAAKGAAILGPCAPAAIGRDHLDPVRGPERGVEGVAVITAIANQSAREIGDEAGLEGGGDPWPLTS